MAYLQNRNTKFTRPAYQTQPRHSGGGHHPYEHRGTHQSGGGFRPSNYGAPHDPYGTRDVKPDVWFNPTPQPGCPSGWASASYSSPRTPLLHPFHDQNRERLLEMLRAVPSASWDVLPNTARVIETKSPWPAPLDSKNFLWEKDRKTGLINTLSSASDILWRRGELAGQHLPTLNTGNSRAGQEEIKLPPGTGAFRLTGEAAEKTPMVTQRLKRLFDDEDRNPTEGLSFPLKYAKTWDKKILGYSKGASKEQKLRFTTPTIADVISYLDKDTAEFIVSVAKATADSMGITDYSRILDWTLIILLYPDGSGFGWHVDGIADFDNHPGAVVNVALGNPGTKKHFDMVNLFGHDQRPYRQTLEVGDVSMMAGEGRARHAHSVAGSEGWRITIAFKQRIENLKRGRDTPEHIETMAADPQVTFDNPVHYVNFDTLLRANKRARTT